ncbi:MAG: response regulator [Betaproteobacteria bacterium]|jgi:response regulator NasT|nr:response regulator [Betaproteobacteria bacterium]MBU6511075.1 response regulator [Betaproteobacteria bacterium]MDE1955192.1 response regulator [Betaproteobacteria bacterium]MDE2151403.1 response regulator [Betaproteobacteria bacterium]
MPLPRLLLVDDDRLVLATTAAELGRLGYDVATADCAEQALLRTASGRFDLAILDLRMPGLSGIELAHLLERRHRLRSLFLSAHGDREEVSQAIQEGALGYLRKPVDPPDMVPAIEAALARSRDLDALAEAKLQLERALSERRQTSMAVGIMMAQRRLSETAAFEALRGEARRQRRKLSEFCGELVATLHRQERG